MCLFLFAASTKRSHECWASSGGVAAEQIHRQASTSPVRSGGPSVAAMLASASASPAPVSPSSSNASVKKKLVSPLNFFRLFIWPLMDFDFFFCLFNKVTIVSTVVEA